VLGKKQPRSVCEQRNLFWLMRHYLSEEFMMETHTNFKKLFTRKLTIIIKKRKTLFLCCFNTSKCSMSDERDEMSRILNFGICYEKLRYILTVSMTTWHFYVCLQTRWERSSKNFFSSTKLMLSKKWRNAYRKMGKFLNRTLLLNQQNTKAFKGTLKINETPQKLSTTSIVLQFHDKNFNFSQNDTPSSSWVGDWEKKSVHSLEKRLSINQQSLRMKKTRQK
jgi:hypothetical protein